MIYAAVRAVLTVYQGLMLLASWVIAWFVQMAAIAVLTPFTTKPQRQDVCSKIFRFGQMLAMDLLNPLWYGRSHKALDISKVPKDRPVIFMINHLSNADPWMVVRFLWPIDCKWICKGSLFNIPFGGWCLRNNGDLAVKFTSAKGGWGTEKGTVRQLMDDAAELLHRNQPIAVFPEGVRNHKPLGPMNEFKPGFFDLAIKEGAVIVPIAVTGSEHLFPKGDWKFGFGTCYQSAGDVIETKGLTTEELIAKTRTAIEEMIATHPDRQKKD